MHEDLQKDTEEIIARTIVPQIKDIITRLPNALFLVGAGNHGMELDSKSTSMHQLRAFLAPNLIVVSSAKSGKIY